MQFTNPYSITTQAVSAAAVTNSSNTTQQLLAAPSNGFGYQLQLITFASSTTTPGTNNGAIAEVIGATSGAVYAAAGNNTGAAAGIQANIPMNLVIDEELELRTGGLGSNQSITGSVFYTQVAVA